MALRLPFRQGRWCYRLSTQRDRIGAPHQLQREAMLGMVGLLVADDVRQGHPETHRS